MKYTFVVAFAMAMAGYADASLSADKMQPSEKRQVDQNSPGYQELVNGWVSGIAPGQPLPGTIDSSATYKRDADVISRGYQDAVDAFVANAGQPVHGTFDSSVPQKRQVDVNSPEFQEAAALHAAYFGKPVDGKYPPLKRDVDWTSEDAQRAIAIAQMACSPSIVCQGGLPKSKRQLPTPEEMKDMAFAASLAGHPNADPYAYQNSKRVPPPDVLEEMGGSYYGQHAKRVPPPEMLDEIDAPELNGGWSQMVEKRQHEPARVARSFKA